MADDEAVEALLLGAEGIVDRPNEAAKLGQAAEVAIGRGYSEDLDARSRSGDFIEIAAQALEIGRVLRCVDEALPENSHPASPIFRHGARLTPKSFRP
jgi:hypothetical protein